MRAEELEQGVKRRRVAVFEPHPRARGPAMSAAPDPRHLAAKHEGIPQRGGHNLEQYGGLSLHADQRRGRALDYPGIRVRDVDARATEPEVTNTCFVSEAFVPAAESGVKVNTPPRVGSEVITDRHAPLNVTTGSTLSGRALAGTAQRGVPALGGLQRFWCFESDRR